MDHICNCSSIPLGYSCVFDELFDEVSTPSFTCSSPFSNGFPIVHPLSSHGLSQYSPIQLYYYKRLIFAGADYQCRIPVRSFCWRYNQHLHRANRRDLYKSKGTEKHRTLFADTGKEKRKESAEFEEILSLLSEVGDDRRCESKNTVLRIRSADTWRNENFVHNRSSSPGVTARHARSDHESVDFLRNKRGIHDKGEKKDNYSSDKDQMINESLNFSSHCSVSSSDGDDETQSKAIPSFTGTLRGRKEFTCQKMLDKEIIGGKIIRDCETTSRFYREPNEKELNASSISKLTQKDRRVGVSQEVNEITCLDESLANSTSSKSLEKTQKTKRNPESGKKIEGGRTETISDGSLDQAFRPDLHPDMGQLTSHLQTGKKDSRNIDFEVKYPLFFKESHNNQTNYIENVDVSRTNNNRAENSHSVSSSSVNIVAEKHTPMNNFDSTNETRQETVEMRLNNHRSFTSSMEQTEEKEEKTEPTRQGQNFNSTSYKEKHLSKKLSSLEDRVNGDKMTLKDKHGETFKLSSTLSSSSGKGGTLPVQIFAGYSSGERSSYTIGGNSDVNIRNTDVSLAVDPVIKVHNSDSTGDIHDTDKLSRAGMVNERQHTLNQSAEEHDSKDSAGVHHTSASDDPSACKNSISKRNGRSLWSVLADLIQLRWSSISGSHNSNIRSCIGSLSTESAKSEEWFSLREEQAENIHKTDPKTASIGNIEEVTTPGLSDCSESEKTDRAEGDMPPSVITEGFSTSKGDYSAYNDDNITYNEDRKSSGSTAFQSVSTSPPTPLSSIRHLIGYQVGGSADGGTTDSSTRDCNEVVGKEGVPKQRRPKRDKYVANDSSGDWGEAYTLGSEQHIIDEMFMREALLESKKAADAWEVPVGAVLVHGGRIIARGCNLVEEKRDCTAHAEMICIREASNTLNSWRLAGTTLYVTLEPCPMCAGAILQARVGTLVWGAPNKIIGADGSWIRLFSEDNGGREWEMAEKPAPPVHPLHPNMKVRRLVLASECADTMQSLFQLRRRNKVQESRPASSEPSRTPLYRHTSRILSKIHHVFHIFCV